MFRKLPWHCPSIVSSTQEQFLSMLSMLSAAFHHLNPIRKFFLTPVWPVSLSHLAIQVVESLKGSLMYVLSLVLAYQGPT